MMYSETKSYIIQPKMLPVVSDIRSRFEPHYPALDRSNRRQSVSDSHDSTATMGSVREALSAVASLSMRPAGICSGFRLIPSVIWHLVQRIPLCRSFRPWRLASLRACTAAARNRSQIRRNHRQLLRRLLIGRRLMPSLPQS
jgi:hypothetical protein